VPPVRVCKLHRFDQISDIYHGLISFRALD
jgi:hypothetical protein